MNDNGFDSKQIVGVFFIIFLALVTIGFVIFHDVEVVSIFFDNTMLIFLVSCVLGVLFAIAGKKTEKILDKIDLTGKKPNDSVFVRVVVFIDTLLHGSRY